MRTSTGRRARDSDQTGGWEEETEGYWMMREKIEVVNVNSLSVLKEGPSGCIVFGGTRWDYFGYST